MTQFLVCLLPILVFSHFTLTYPPSRAFGSMKNAGQCMGDFPNQPGHNGTCLWFNDGCFIGCDRCTGNSTDNSKSGCKPDMGQPIERTLPERYRTYPDMTGITDDGQIYDVYPAMKWNPWFAPGTAPVESSCGLAGGFYKPLNGYPGNGGYPPNGVQHGMDGRYMPESEKTIWPRGSQQEVAVSVNANHGGGYAYRLCKKPADNSFEYLTEECFAQGHLDFAGNKQWIQWGIDKSSRYEIDAVRVKTGTFPYNSTWTRFPMPPCSTYLGGDARGESQIPGQIQAGEECRTTQFPAPFPELYGYGLTQCLFPGLELPTGGVFKPTDKACTEDDIKKVSQLFNVNFIDLVQIPKDIQPGEYVMSWRLDCEQTPQVWASCADITIV